MISEIEKRILNWFEEHLFAVALAGICLLAFGIRCSLRAIVSIDAADYLLPWYNHMSDGIFSLREQVGNYNMFYQFLISLMTYIPINPLSAYKALSCMFDFGIAVTTFLWVKKLKSDSWTALFAFSCVLLSPVVCLNSAAWAQCDALYTFFAILALLFLSEEKYVWAFIFFGGAVANKLQAIFVLPAFLTIYFLKKQFSIAYFLLIPISMVILCLPNIIMGRRVWDVFLIYFEQADTYHQMYMNYPSFWALISGPEQYENLAGMAIFMTVGILLIMVLYWSIKRIPCNARDYIDIAFLMSYTCVLFLPAMHERYGYCSEVLAIIVAFSHKKTIPLCVMMMAVTCISYSVFLFGISTDFRCLGCVNTLVYMAYMVILLYIDREENEVLS